MEQYWKVEFVYILMFVQVSYYELLLFCEFVYVCVLFMLLCTTKIVLLIGGNT